MDSLLEAIKQWSYKGIPPVNRACHQGSINNHF
jgi:hypothetical protein